MNSRRALETRRNEVLRILDEADQMKNVEGFLWRTTREGGSCVKCTSRRGIVFSREEILELLKTGFCVHEAGCFCEVSVVLNA